MRTYRYFKTLKGTAQISGRCTVFSKLQEWLRITSCYSTLLTLLVWTPSSVHMLPTECNQIKKQLWTHKECKSFPFSFGVNYSKVCEQIRKLFFTYSRWKYINHTWKISAPTDFIEANSINQKTSFWFVTFRCSWSTENQKSEVLRSV